MLWNEMKNRPEFPCPFLLLPMMLSQEDDIMLKYLLEMYFIICIKKSKYSSFDRITFQHILKLRNRWLVTLVPRLCDVRVEISVILLVFPLGSQNVAVLVTIHEGRQSREGTSFTQGCFTALLKKTSIPRTPLLKQLLVKERETALKGS